MPIYNYNESLIKDFKPYKEIDIDKDLFRKINEIFSQIESNYYEEIRNTSNNNNFQIKSESIADDLVEKIENLLNIKLQSDYFGIHKLAHPFIVAPGKHTRIGPKEDPSRLIKLRTMEGWSGTILKTAIGNDREGNSSMSKSRRDEYWPVYQHIDKTNFLSGERGAKLDIDNYCNNFLKTSIEIGKNRNFMIVPSLMCGLPYESNKKEWEYSIKTISKTSKSIELDFSPTAFEKDNIDQIVDDLLKIFMNHADENISIKISGQYRQIIPLIQEKINNNQVDKSILKNIRFIVFNREISILPIPWIIALYRSSVGSDAVYHKNIYSLFNFHVKNPNQDFMRFSYSGGIINGISSFNAIAISKSGSIQIATELMRQGGINALNRILGGFALYLHWASKKLEKEEGLDVYSVQKLKGLYYKNEIKERINKFLDFDKTSYIANVNPDLCDGSCRSNSLINSSLVCPASVVCPSAAFEIKSNPKFRKIISNLCIGCGNCIQTCIKQAITSIKKEKLD